MGVGEMNTVEGASTSALVESGSGSVNRDPAEVPTKAPAWERWAPYVAAFAVGLPSLLTYYPPMSDLPLHEGVVGVVRHLHDPEYFPGDIYELNVGHPNQLFTILSSLLSFLTGTRW